jgi:hypothetical protein
MHKYSCDMLPAANTYAPLAAPPEEQGAPLNSCGTLRLCDLSALAQTLQASPSTSTRWTAPRTTTSAWAWPPWLMWCAETSASCPSHQTPLTLRMPSRQRVTVRPGYWFNLAAVVISNMNHSCSSVCCSYGSLFILHANILSAALRVSVD